MISDTNLSNQADTLQQAPPTQKKPTSHWRTFSVLLIILNFPFVAGLIAGLISELQFWQGLEYMISGFIQSMRSWYFYVVPLAIVDSVAVMSYIKKQPPPWIILFILLLTINVMFFLYLRWGLSQSGGGVGGLFVIASVLTLLLIDCTMICSYIYIRLPQSRPKAKIIYCTTFLFLIALALLILSVF